MITDPRRYLVRMLLFLVAVGIIAGLLHAPLSDAFLGNAALNGMILLTLALGIAYIIRQNLRLVPEREWITAVQKTSQLDPPGARPVLLATVYAMLADSRQDTQLSALSMRSVLDGVAARLDEGREISRYMIGLLVFLGLLGTFWGLLQTIGAVGGVVNSIDANNSDFAAMMSQLRTGLDRHYQVCPLPFHLRFLVLPDHLFLAFSIYSLVRLWDGFLTN